MRPLIDRSLVFSVLAGLALIGVSATAEEWSRFRGPNGSGVSSETRLPVEFGPTRNVAWVAEVPFGRSSPAVAGDRIFLTAVDEGKLVTLALDRKSGREVWRWEIEPSERAEFHTATDSATPTPVTDGSNVYVFFHEFGVVSYDAAGKERWRVALGPFRNFYGMAASPVLAGGRLIILCDQAEESFLLALDKETGETLWRSERAQRFEAYSTPILYPNAEEPTAIIVSGSRWVDAYDPKTGETIWTLPGFGFSPISSPVILGDLVFVNAIDHAENGWADFGELLEKHDKDGDGELSREDVADMWISRHYGWLNGDGEGNITAADWKHLENEVVTESWGVYAIRVGDGKAEKVWNYRKNVPYIPSPLIEGEVFFMVNDSIVTSLDARTGELLKRGRLGQGPAKVYASPIAAGGKIYVPTMEGEVAILSAEAEWEVLGTNSLGEEIWSTPSIAGDHLLVRTKGKLYSFAQGAGAAAGEAEPSSR